MKPPAIPHDPRIAPPAINMELAAEGERLAAEIAAAAAAQRQELIDDISECMNDRTDLDVGFGELSEAVVEFLEKRGLISFGNTP